MLGAAAFGAKTFDVFWGGVADMKLKDGPADDPLVCAPNMDWFCSAGAGVAGPCPPNWKLKDPDGVGVAEAPNGVEDACPGPPASKVKDPCWLDEEFWLLPKLKGPPPPGVVVEPPVKLKFADPAPGPLACEPLPPNVNEDDAAWLPPELKTDCAFSVGALFCEPKLNVELAAGALLPKKLDLAAGSSGFCSAGAAEPNWKECVDAVLLPKPLDASGCVEDPNDEVAPKAGLGSCPVTGLACLCALCPNLPPSLLGVNIFLPGIGLLGAEFSVTPLNMDFLSAWPIGDAGR